MRAARDSHRAVRENAGGTPELRTRAIRSHCLLHLLPCGNVSIPGPLSSLVGARRLPPEWLMKNPGTILPKIARMFVSDRKGDPARPSPTSHARAQISVSTAKVSLMSEMAPSATRPSSGHLIPQSVRMGRLPHRPMVSRAAGHIRGIPPPNGQCPSSNSSRIW